MFRHVLHSRYNSENNITVKTYACYQAGRSSQTLLSIL